MIYIGLGANLPGTYKSPRLALEHACKTIKTQGVAITAASPVYVTSPVPASEQPDFCNAVIAVETALSPRQLLRLLQRIEEDMGRVRSAPNAERVIDLDLIAYDDKIINETEMIVPHPRMHERAFVLHPLNDIAPGWVHPVTKKTIADLIRAVSPDQKIRADGKLCL